MVKNYVKVALRNLLRNKGLTAINVGGLALGLASCLLIFAYITDERSYDTFHNQAENIYRVVLSTSADGRPTNANVNFALGPALKKDFPEIKEFVRLRKTGQRGTKSLVRHGEASFYEQRFLFADSTVFDVFSIPIIAGDPQTALARPNTVVLTAETAQKYFKDEDPIGKTLVVDPFGNGREMELSVTGVVQAMPHNSHVHFDFLASLVSTSDDFAQFAAIEQVFTYLLLHEGSDQGAMEAKFLEFLRRNWREDPWYSISLQPLLDIRLYSQLRSEIEANGNILYVQMFAVIAVFVVLIACINFMNLMTARSLSRAKEVGVRKTVGAARNQLVAQFLTESVVLSVIAGLFAVVLADLFTPLFNQLTGKEVHILAYFGWPFYIGFIGTSLFVGILAGAYPAFVLSRFRPASILKGSAKNQRSGFLLRQGLVVFQFAISMTLIAATGVVFSQLNYVQTKNLGYADDQIVVMLLNNDVRARYEAFRQELLQHASIKNSATSSLVPTMGTSHNMFKMEGIEDEWSFSTYLIDGEFADTYDLSILAGSDVRKIADQGGGELLISEMAVRQMGLENMDDVLGRSMAVQNMVGRAAGVVNDIHVYSFRQKMYASAFMVTPIQNHKYLSIRLTKAHITDGLGHVQDVWESMFPAYPFDYFFLDESFAQMHRSDTQLATTLTWFAFLAIFVACLGLFGLSAYMAEQRIKEIGIRKVFGASVLGIVVLFFRGFLKPVVIGAVIAIPVVYYLGSGWLENFAYRVEMGATPFLIAAILLVLIAFLTVSFNTAKAALRNPIYSLRNE